MKKKFYAYVLKMDKEKEKYKEKEDIKFYVGASYDVKQRIEEHKKEEGSQFVNILF